MEMMGGTCGTYWGREMHAEFWYQNLKKKNYLEDLGVDGTVILKSILMKQDEARTGFI